MAIYKESSVYTGFDKNLRWGSLLLMLGVLCAEIYYTLIGRMHWEVWVYCAVFIFLWCWRCGFDYTYSFNPKEFIVEQAGLGFSKTYRYPFSEIESISYACDRKLFKRDGVNKYVSRFSSSDANDLRLIVVLKDGKKLGVMIKSTAIILDKIKKIQPDKFGRQKA